VVHYELSSFIFKKTITGGLEMSFLLGVMAGLLISYLILDICESAAKYRR